jgi:hypothetical protein
MAIDGIIRTALGAAIASVIGALATLLVERAWKRHKAKQDKKKEP